jgi:hypothetical protein
MRDGALNVVLMKTKKDKRNLLQLKASSETCDLLIRE